jgi:AraC-like DNA-binding protein
VTERARARFLPSLGGLELIEAVHDRPHFPPHAHDTYALGLVDRGVNRFRYRGAWHAAPAGALCTVTPDEVHTVEPAGATGFAYRCIYPPAALVTEVAEAAEGLGALRASGTILLPPVIEDPEAARLAAALLGAVDAGAPPLAAEARLAALLGTVLERHARPGIRTGRPEVGGRGVARARELLAARLAENVTLRELADVAGAGRFALLRAFSRAYGLPPHAWVIQERVRRAQGLLRAGGRPAEVALELGFTDQSHLTRHFKRLTGVTPGRYRAAAGRG